MVLDPSIRAPYGYSGNEWVGFDDAASLGAKVLTLVKPKRLKGAMFWAIDLDDFQNMCNRGRFPLINAVKDTLGRDIISKNTTEPPEGKSQAIPTLDGLPLSHSIVLTAPLIILIFLIV